MYIEAIGFDDLIQNGTVTGGAEIMSLTFDANGNRTGTTDNGVTKNYTTDELNQYTEKERRGQI